MKSLVASAILGIVVATAGAVSVGASPNTLVEDLLRQSIEQGS